MQEDKEKIEDFMALWKKKSSEHKGPSIIGETMNQLESLKRENEQLRQKIAENIDLISKSEEVIRNLSTDRERLRVENEEALMELTMRANKLENENLELGNKVKSMVKLLMEKDEEIKNLMNAPREDSFSIDKEFQLELSQKNDKIKLLNKELSDLKIENENLQAQLVEKLKKIPTYVVPVDQPEDKVLKPMPPEGSPQPLENLCQDLQSDLNKYKRIIDQINQEKNQLKQALEKQGITFNVEELNALKNENELLRKDLQELQDSLSPSEHNQTISQDQSQLINELQEKVIEREKEIAELKLSQGVDLSDSKEPMADLVEELQKTINKLKLTIQEKDQKISELTKLINP